MSELGSSRAWCCVCELSGCLAGGVIGACGECECGRVTVSRYDGGGMVLWHINKSVVDEQGAMGGMYGS